VTASNPIEHARCNDAVGAAGRYRIQPCHPRGGALASALPLRTPPTEHHAEDDVHRPWRLTLPIDV
jgi:hypothetical protein